MPAAQTAARARHCSKRRAGRSPSDEAKQALAAAVARIREADVHRDRLAMSNKVVAESRRRWSPALLLSRRINALEWRWPLSTYRAKNANSLSRAMLERLAEAEAMTLDDYRADIWQAGSASATSTRQLGGLTDGVITLSATGAAPVGLQSTGDPIFAVPCSLLGVPAISLPLFCARRICRSVCR